jgi:hypothetical protein
VTCWVREPAEIPTEWDLDRHIPLHPLSYRTEGEEVTVGRTDVDSYAVLPPDGAQLVRRLAAGDTPRAAAEWYSSTYGTDVDMGDLLTRLSTLNFVADQNRSESAVVDSRRWQALGRVTFSPLAWVGYVLLVTWWVVAMVRSPDLVPRYQNLFFSDYYTIVMVTLLLGQIPAVLVHEGFHALAGFRLGLNSRLSVGRRLYYVVFETSLDGLVLLPRRKRYLPILAGMVADVLVLAALTLIADMARDSNGALSSFGGVCLALAFSTVLRLAWQFFLFLQTDIYFLVTTALGCSDLHSTAKAVLRNRGNRLIGRSDRLEPEGSWPATDRRAARWYSWLMVAGYALSIATLVFVVVPALFQIALGLVEGLTGGDQDGFARLLDSSAFVFLVLVQITVALWIAWRDRHRHDRNTLVHS